MKGSEKSMELDERKIKILNAIIQTYLETGEPVGSRTISRFTDLKLSSATLHNPRFLQIPFLEALHCL